MSLAAVFWHYWLAVPLTVLGVLGVLGVIVGYAKNVSSLRYPKHEE